MFGYIKPFKPELKVMEFDTYQAVYCGLCRQLGKDYGPFARLTLSYDFTFVALLELGLRENFCGFQKMRCPANPLKKKTCIASCEGMELVSACAMTMLYYKVRDNLQDSRGFFCKLKYRLLQPFAAAARRKARARYPQLDAIFDEMMRRQLALEQAETASIDAAAEPTAYALGEMFALLAADEEKRRVLARMGYLLGRWVYLTDALDDLEQDRQQQSYNPFWMKFPDEDGTAIRDYGQGVLNVTVAELASAYELLTFSRYKTILDNIIYLGLPAAAKQVLSGTHGKCREKILVRDQF